MKIKKTLKVEVDIWEHIMRLKLDKKHKSTCDVLREELGVKKT